MVSFHGRVARFGKSWLTNGRGEVAEMGVEDREDRFESVVEGVEPWADADEERVLRDGRLAVRGEGEGLAGLLVEVG